MRHNVSAADHTQRLDRFAELLSLDLSTTDIADRMSIRKQLAQKYLTELRREFGWQAQ
jgi:hypothetical protein